MERNGRISDCVHFVDVQNITVYLFQFLNREDAMRERRCIRRETVLHDACMVTGQGKTVPPFFVGGDFRLNVVPDGRSVGYRESSFLRTCGFLC